MTKTAQKATIRDGRLLVDGAAVALPTGGRKVIACYASRNGKYVVAADDLAGIYLLEGDKVVWRGNLVPGTTKKVAVSEDGVYVFATFDMRGPGVLVFAKGEHEWNSCLKLSLGALPLTDKVTDVAGEKFPVADVQINLPRCALSVVRGELAVSTQDMDSWNCMRVI